MRTIALSLSLGRYCRVFTIPGVAEMLLAEPNTRLVVLSPAANDPAFRRHLGLDGDVTFAQLPDYVPSRTLLQRGLRKVLAANQRRRTVFLTAMRAYRAAQRWQEPRPLRAPLAGCRPSVIVTASPGFNSLSDIPVVREAQRARIPTFCMVYGWDNLMIKGFMPTRPDVLGVWNDLMLREAVQDHHYARDRVRVIGPPQFDLLLDDAAILPRDEVVRRLGLDPARRIILFTTGTLKRSTNGYIMDMLVKAIDEGRLSAPAQIVCRRHPLGKGKDEEIYAKYAGHPHVRFDASANHFVPGGWTPDRAEMGWLASLIAHAGVVVNIASTITLEAALLDRPIINVGFNPDEPERFARNIVEGAFRRHYRYVLERDACAVVTSEDDLTRRIDEFFRDPGRQRAERRRLAEDISHRLDGKAARRLADAILETADGRWVPRAGDRAPGRREARGVLRRTAASTMAGWS